MTMDQEIKRVGPENSLLTSQEWAICEQIAVREGPHGPRALALLALDEGITQAQAGERAGLSRGQVKYWVARFRKQRLSIFPDGLLDEPDAKETVEPATEIEEKPEKATSVKDKKAKRGKKAKGKKGKRTKAKKAKKSKGTKKAKKKTGKAGKKKAKKVKKAKK